VGMVATCAANISVQCRHSWQLLLL